MRLYCSLLVSIALLLTWGCESLRLGRLAGLAALAVSLCNSPPSLATTESLPSHHKVYFGVGCFWHVQHEFVEAEKRLLGRNDDQISSTAGYAGGKAGEKDARVCYHNFQGAPDYGKLGYAEVVQVDVPDDSLGAFASQYFSLFQNKDRPDRGDRGLEYRALLGLEGGLQPSSPLYQQVARVAAEKGFRLQPGVGGDADTLDRGGLVYVMDAQAFPFQQAEVYHQFHDGFMPGEQYPAAYHELRGLRLRAGTLRDTGCPDSLF
eukprot:gene35109-42523_t